MRILALFLVAAILSTLFWLKTDFSFAGVPHVDMSARLNRAALTLAGPIAMIIDYGVKQLAQLEFCGLRRSEWLAQLDDPDESL